MLLDLNIRADWWRDERWTSVLILGGPCEWQAPTTNIGGPGRLPHDRSHCSVLNLPGFPSLATCSECCRRTLNGKEQLRHRAVSVRRHGFFVQLFCSLFIPVVAQKSLVYMTAASRICHWPLSWASQLPGCGLFFLLLVLVTSSAKMARAVCEFCMWFDHTWRWSASSM